MPNTLLSVPLDSKSYLNLCTQSIKLSGQKSLQYFHCYFGKLSDLYIFLGSENRFNPNKITLIENYSYPHQFKRLRRNRAEYNVHCVSLLVPQGECLRFEYARKKNLKKMLPYPRLQRKRKGPFFHNFLARQKPS